MQYGANAFPLVYKSRNMKHPSSIPGQYCLMVITHCKLGSTFTLICNRTSMFVNTRKVLTETAGHNIIIIHSYSESSPKPNKV